MMERTASLLAATAALVLIRAASPAVAGALGPEAVHADVRFDQRDAEVLATGFEQIRAAYVDPVPLGPVAVAGLRGLAAIEPRLIVDSIGAVVQARIDGRVIALYWVPAGGGAGAWGGLAATILKQARANSPLLAAQSAQSLYDVVFAASARALDRYSHYDPPGVGAAKLVKPRAALPVEPTGQASTSGATDPSGALYLRVARFDEQSMSDAARILVADTKATSRGVILDLRGNPGGLLEPAMQLGELFLDQGTLATTLGRTEQSQQRFSAGGSGDVTFGAPLIVLIDGNTASAAEILAAGLQDLGRAVVIGGRSYGKGTVQAGFVLPGGGVLHMTWARAVAPSGYTIDGMGVLPNLCTTRDGATAEPDALRLRRRADPASAEDRAAVDAACPQQGGAEGSELNAARRLIQDHAAWRAALMPADLIKLAQIR